MKWALVIMLFAVSSAVAQTPTPAERGFFNRMLHPFGSAKTKAPKYQDPRLRGLLLDVQVPTEPVRLSEVRQLRVHVVLTNLGSNPVALDFPTSQRIDIQLLNPAEQLVYNETIATRELQPGRVYSVEVFFPKYSELRGRQKFMTAP